MRAGGATVFTCVEGRSAQTRASADDAGFVQSPDYVALVHDVDVVLSITAPAAAMVLAGEVADAVRHASADICYVDCNAVAPSTARAIAETLEGAGARFVDACIIGPPPRDDLVTKLYVSGPHADVAARLGDVGLDVRVVSGVVGSASALKMAYAAITKGSTALAVYALVSARSNGVSSALTDELGDSLPELLALVDGWIPPMPAKAGRWVAEMEELESTVAAVGLPAGTFASLASLYAWVAAQHVDQAETVDGVVGQLVEGLRADHRQA